jgi:hypothetical protein
VKEKDSIIYLAGDSSLDNKYWLGNNYKEPVKSYSGILKCMRPDISYWLNRKLEDQGINAVCVNCAVEASSEFGLFRYFGIEENRAP